jgi:hypothetical protein
VESLISLSSAAALVSLDLLLLKAALSYLGKKDDLLAALKATGLLTLKLGTMVLGLGWICRQAWFRTAPVAFGIAIPLLGLMFLGGSVKREKNDA